MGAEPVVVLYASISVLNWMRAATGSQCKETKRGVTWALLGSLKTSRAAACYACYVGYCMFIKNKFCNNQLFRSGPLTLFWSGPLTLMKIQIWTLECRL